MSAEQFDIEYVPRPVYDALLSAWRQRGDFILDLSKTGKYGKRHDDSTPSQRGGNRGCVGRDAGARESV